MIDDIKGWVAYLFNIELNNDKLLDSDEKIELLDNLNQISGLLVALGILSIIIDETNWIGYILIIPLVIFRFIFINIDESEAP